jgi:hypothetical protein
MMSVDPFIVFLEGGWGPSESSTTRYGADSSSPPLSTWRAASPSRMMRFAAPATRCCTRLWKMIGSSTRGWSARGNEAITRGMAKS